MEHVWKDEVGLINQLVWPDRCMSLTVNHENLFDKRDRVLQPRWANHIFHMHFRTSGNWMQTSIFNSFVFISKAKFDIPLTFHGNALIVTHDWRRPTPSPRAIIYLLICWFLLLDIVFGVVENRLDQGGSVHILQTNEASDTDWRVFATSQLECSQRY